MQLARLDIDIPRQNIVEDDVLNEIVAVIFFVVILLDRRKRDRKQVAVLGGRFVNAFDKYGKLRFHFAAKRLIRIAVADKYLVRVAGVKREKVASLADFGQIAARNDRCAVVHNADHTVDTIAHLMNDPLKKPV